ncbi:hypothetical protein VTG60DRAFT_7154 [Thermothelomyces hinnuleus]
MFRSTGFLASHGLGFLPDRMVCVGCNGALFHSQLASTERPDSLSPPSPNLLQVAATGTRPANHSDRRTSGSRLASCGNILRCKSIIVQPSARFALGSRERSH